MKIGTNILYPDNNIIIKVIYLLNNNWMAYQLDIFIPKTALQELKTLITQWLKDN